MICVDQSREGLTGEKSVFEELSGGFDTLALGAQEVNSRAYCSWFGFSGQAQQKQLSKLSGGERNRVQLAKVPRPRHYLPCRHARRRFLPCRYLPCRDLPCRDSPCATKHAATYCAAPSPAQVLKSGGNVLLLDEPTNDLDVNTMRSLEEVRGSTAMRQLCRAPRARFLTADPDHWP